MLVYLFLLFDADVICIERLFDTRSCKATGSLSFHKLESVYSGSCFCDRLKMIVMQTWRIDSLPFCYYHVQSPFGFVTGGIFTKSWYWGLPCTSTWFGLLLWKYLISLACTGWFACQEFSGDLKFATYCEDDESILWQIMIIIMTENRSSLMLWAIAYRTSNPAMPSFFSRDQCFARSPHPLAKKVTWSLHNDEAHGQLTNRIISYMHEIASKLSKHSSSAEVNVTRTNELRFNEWKILLVPMFT